MKKYCKERQRDLALDLEMVVVVHCGEASPGKRLFSKTRNCISTRTCLSKESCSKKVTISFYRNETSYFKDKLQIRRSVLSIQHPPLQREVVKNGYFMVRLTVEEGGQPLGPDRKQMWKFWTIFFIEIWFFDTQNIFYLIVKGLKNAFFMSFRLLLYHYPTVLWQESLTREELGNLVVG